MNYTSIKKRKEARICRGLPLRDTRGTLQLGCCELMVRGAAVGGGSCPCRKHGDGSKPGPEANAASE